VLYYLILLNHKGFVMAKRNL